LQGVVGNIPAASAIQLRIQEKLRPNGAIQIYYYY